MGFGGGKGRVRRRGDIYWGGAFHGGKDETEVSPLGDTWWSNIALNSVSRQIRRGFSLDVALKSSVRFAQSGMSLQSMHSGKWQMF